MYLVRVAMVLTALDNAAQFLPSPWIRKEFPSEAPPAYPMDGSGGAYLHGRRGNSNH